MDIKLSFTLPAIAFGSDPYFFSKSPAQDVELANENNKAEKTTPQTKLRNVSVIMFETLR